MKFLQGKTPLFWWRLFFVVAAGAFSLLVILQPPPWRVLADAGGMDKMTVNRFATAWSWWGGVGGIMVMAGLFVIAPWWARAPQTETATARLRPPTPRWFWPLVLAAVATCGGIAGPTLEHSLWDDEIQSLNWYYLGRFERTGEQGELRFKSCPWRRTFFGYTTPNNHVFYNVLARACNGIWSTVAQPQGWRFSHLAIRAPAFLAALGAVALLALLLKEFGLPAAGAAAAWFFAVHPWFTEHAALARGYTLVMFLSLAAVIVWRRALLTGSWVWWGCFSVLSFLLLWTYPGSLFMVVPLHLAAVILILRGAESVAVPVRTQLSRWFCTNSVVAAGTLPLLLPLYPQMKKYLAMLASDPVEIGAPWLRDVFWLFTGGAAWFRGISTADWQYHDMQLVAGSWGSGGLAVLAAAVVVPFLAGLWTMARRGPIGSALVICASAAPVLHFLYARMQKVGIADWYVIYALPFVAMFWGLGTVQIGRLLGRLAPRSPAIMPATAVVLLLLCAAATHPVRAWQTVHPRTPHLESVLIAREQPGNYLSETNRRMLTFAFIHAPVLYDPHLITLTSPAELILLCRQADRGNRPLAGSFNCLHVMQRENRRALELLHDPRLFGRSRKLGSSEPGFDRHIFFYTPGSASEYDFSAVLTPSEIDFVEQHAATRSEMFFGVKEER
jgi:hypothetical protein